LIFAVIAAFIAREKPASADVEKFYRLDRQKRINDQVGIDPCPRVSPIIRDESGELAEDPVGGIAFVVNLLHTGRYISGLSRAS